MGVPCLPIFLDYLNYCVFQTCRIHEFEVVASAVLGRPIVRIEQYGDCTVGHLTLTS